MRLMTNQDSLATDEDLNHMNDEPVLKLRKAIFKDLSKKVKAYGEGKNKKLMGGLEEDLEEVEVSGKKLMRKPSISMTSMESSF